MTIRVVPVFQLLAGKSGKAVVCSMGPGLIDLTLFAGNLLQALPRCAYGAQR